MPFKLTIEKQARAWLDGFVPASSPGILTANDQTEMHAAWERAGVSSRILIKNLDVMTEGAPDPTQAGLDIIEQLNSGHCEPAEA